MTAAASPARTETLASRLVRRLRHEHDEISATTPLRPRPAQLSLPLGEQERCDGELTLPSLFRETRRISSILSYEQASLDQIIPETAPQQGVSHDRLMLPGGIGLVLYDGIEGALAFDWMQWGGQAKQRAANAPLRLEPTVKLTDVIGGRAFRKLAQRRCVVPLTRYSVPVHDGEVWTHRWIALEGSQIACAAGIWTGKPGEPACFALVIDEENPAQDAERPGPLLLAESDLLPWLRAPIKDALAHIGKQAGTSD